MPTPLIYRVSSTGERTLALEVDLFISGGMAMEVQLTDNPVEDGSDVTDNQSIRPSTIDVEAAVTDRPMGGTYVPGRARAAWEALKEMRASREELVVVIPDLGEQRNVRLTSVRPTINVANGMDVLRFSASFREIVIATSQRVPAQKRRETNKKPAVELGDKSAKPANSATASKSITLLEQWRTGESGRSAIRALLSSLGGE